MILQDVFAKKNHLRGLTLGQFAANTLRKSSHTIKPQLGRLLFSFPESLSFQHFFSSVIHSNQQQGGGGEGT
jgi:hypothetical protein